MIVKAARPDPDRRTGFPPTFQRRWFPFSKAIRHQPLAGNSPQTLLLRWIFFFTVPRVLVVEKHSLQRSADK